jgi:hypothetical protein
MLEHEKPKQGYSREIGGEAGEGTYGGRNRSKPKGMPDRRDADYVVSNRDELADAVKDDNAKVYYNDHIEITKQDTVWFGDGVVLFGDYCNPDVPGVGHWIYHSDTGDNNYSRKCFAHAYGKPAKLYGVYALGPRLHYFDPDHTSDEFRDMTCSFMHEYAGANDGLFEAVGCRFSGWTLAGLELGAKGYRTEAHVRQSTLNMNYMEHLGYGLEQYRGDLWVDQCLMDQCRHAISGFGYGDETIDVTRSIFGPGPWAGHALDMHGLANNISTTSNVAGKHLRARNCSFMSTRDVNGTKQEGIAIRGVPNELSWFRNNEFWHPPISDPPGRQGDAVRQESGTSGWKKVQLRNNAFNGPTNRQNIGAPRVKQPAPKPKPDPKPKPKPKPKPPDEKIDKPALSGDTKTLTISAAKHGEPGGYWFYVKGAARKADKAEKNDTVIPRKNGVTTLKGHVWPNWTDTFELEQNANIVSAWPTGTITAAIDGEPLEGLAALYANEADRKFKHV